MLVLGKGSTSELHPRPWPALLPTGDLFLSLPGLGSSYLSPEKILQGAIANSGLIGLTREACPSSLPPTLDDSAPPALAPRPPGNGGALTQPWGALSSA